MLDSIAAGVAVGPATVISHQEGRVRLALPTGEVEADLALAYPYTPLPGDIVLVIGEAEHYVIGVLRGKGKSSFVVPGDMELRAEGRVEIAGGQGVTIKGPQVLLRADRVETIARTVFERVVDSYRWVKGLMQTSAGKSRTTVEGAATLHAERIVGIAEKDVRLDGSRINLG